MKTSSVKCLIMLISLSLGTGAVNAFASSFTAKSPRQIPASARPQYQLRYPTITATSLASALAEPEDGTRLSSDADADAEPSSSPTTNVELWLDLRGTAIVPQAAVSHLTDDLVGGDYAPPTEGKARCIVDKVLLSEDGVARALQHMGGAELSDPLQPDVFYVRDADGTVRDVRDYAAVVGSVVSLENDEVVDPIPALDSVSRGGWVVIDSDDIKDQDRRGEAVAGLVEFLSAGTSAASGGPLLLGDTSLVCVEDVGAREGDRGGIALSCKTNTDILRAGAAIQAMASGSAISATDSGILLQAGQDEGSAPLNAAAILPFDAFLWKAASSIFGEILE